MPFDREMFEYEFLYKEPAMGVAVEATFTERPAITIFKARVEGVALKYTAFYPGAAGNIFMLGWDHAMLIERVEVASVCPIHRLEKEPMCPSLPYHQRA